MSTGGGVWKALERGASINCEVVQLFVKNNMQWFEITNPEAVDTPALLVYPERVKQNILLLIEMAGSKTALRPHVKTNKMREVCQLMLDAGITKFKCATIAEAEMLGRLKAPDVVFAYQPVGPKANRLLALVQMFGQTHFCALNNPFLEPIFELFADFSEEAIDLSNSLI